MGFQNPDSGKNWKELKKLDPDPRLKHRIRVGAFKIPVPDPQLPGYKPINSAITKQICSEILSAGRKLCTIANFSAKE